MRNFRNGKKCIFVSEVEVRQAPPCAGGQGGACPGWCTGRMQAVEKSDGVSGSARSVRY